MDKNEILKLVKELNNIISDLQKASQKIAEIVSKLSDEDKKKTLTLQFYYMHDGHRFSPLKGNTLDEVIAHCNEIRGKSPWGMLCPVIVKDGDKDSRRVGVGAHCSGLGRQKEWEDSVQVWKSSIMADAEIMQLIS
jgi:hypothetical protein